MKSKVITTILTMFACALPLHAEEAQKTPPPIDLNARHPAGVNPKLMSDDPTYGYSENNPIKVGSREEHGGPKAEREYLDSLLDSNGKPIKYARLGSGGKGPDGNILDIYKITLEDGSEVRIWIDMYHPRNKPARQPSPVGLYKKKG